MEVAGGVISVSGTHTYLTAGLFHPTVVLSHVPTGRTATADASVTSEPDVSSSLSIRRGGQLYNFRTGLYNVQLTITNNAATPLTKPFELVVAGLPGSVSVANASGTTGAGLPYLLVAPPAPIAPGQSMVVTLTFRNPARLLFDYALRAYSIS